MKQFSCAFSVFAILGMLLSPIIVFGRTKVSSNHHKLSSREKARTERRVSIFRSLSSAADPSSGDMNEPVSAEVAIDVIKSIQENPVEQKRQQLLDGLPAERLSAPAIVALSKWRAQETSILLQRRLDTILESPEVFRKLESAVFEPGSPAESQIAIIHVLGGFNHLSSARVLNELRAEAKDTSVREACDAALQKMGGAPRFREPVLDGTPVRLRW